MWPSDKELTSYYTQQLGDNYAADKDEKQTLTAVEFEPTYWFGEYEIPGLKPLFSGYSQWESFDSWKKDDKYKELSYFFKLNNNLLILDTSIEIPSSKGIEMQTIGSMGDTLSKIKQMENIASHIKYGIDDNNTYGLQCHSDGTVDASTKPLYLFDGLGNQSAVINEADLLVESFVK